MGGGVSWTLHDLAITNMVWYIYDIAITNIVP